MPVFVFRCLCSFFVACVRVCVQGVSRECCELEGAVSQLRHVAAGLKSAQQVRMASSAQRDELRSKNTSASRNPWADTSDDEGRDDREVLYSSQLFCPH